MKKKILMYGNCQLSVLAKILLQNNLFTEKYEILFAGNYSLESVWDGGYVIAPFQYSNNNHSEEKQFNKNVVSRIDDAFSQADIIIFQNFKRDLDRPDEVTTEYFYEKYPNKYFLCIPSFYFTGYFMKSYDFNAAFVDIISFLINKGLNNTDIFEWFKNGYFEEIESLKSKNVLDSITEMKNREKTESNMYANFISILDILCEYDTKLLCYHHSHPSRYYFKRVYDRIVYYMDRSLESFELNQNDIFCPGSTIPFLGDMNFFNQSYSTIKKLEDERTMFNHVTLTQEYINEQISNVYKIHMKDWIY